MKKVTTAKATTPAQPAPEPVKTEAVKPKSVKKAPAEAVPTITAVPEAAPKKKPASAAKSAPAPKARPLETVPALENVPMSAPRLATTIIAQIDVGFGNTLYVRGEGPGLSWERGVPLDCVADDKWSITLSNAERPVVFKFLLNDLTWCTGDDFVAPAGATLTLVPVF